MDARHRFWAHAALLALAAGWLAGCGEDATGQGSPGELQVPPGFVITTYAEVPGARSLTLGEEGTVFVGTRGGGRVYAVRDEDGDGTGERVVVIAEGLESPNGVAMRDGDLYVAEISRIMRYDAIESRLDDPPAPVVIRDDFPTDRAHGWKFIAFGPDGKLYVPVGAPCNICLSDDPIYASITRMDPDGTDREIFAHGIRNTVGFDWNPETGVLWFTDNGRDRLGDDVPPDELNRALEPGMHFGYPFVHGRDVRDPEFHDRMPPDLDWTPPVAEFGAHVAALGMTFYRGDMFPAEYRNQILVAQHGSWNRSSKVGYRVVLVRHDGATVTGVEPFATGWLRGESNWGRPVDVLELPDGSLLISDDQGGRLWRVTYGE